MSVSVLPMLAMAMASHARLCLLASLCGCKEGTELRICPVHLSLLSILSTRRGPLLPVPEEALCSICRCAFIKLPLKVQ